jgi:hypothetical protein
MDWDLISADFGACDGALCDIYVQNVSINDWRAVLNRLRKEWSGLELRIGNEVTGIPSDISELLTRQRDDESPLLRVPLDGTMLNCHFFSDEEIEFDLDPRDMRREMLPRLCEFLELLSSTTSKLVILTVENMPEAIIMRVEPTSARVEYVGPAFD